MDQPTQFQPIEGLDRQRRHDDQLESPVVAHSPRNATRHSWNSAQAVPQTWRPQLLDELLEMQNSTGANRWDGHVIIGDPNYW